ncbi:MAG TPA: D-alanyl-D-alanine carboxypeptidase [Clostridia bacterium]|nr:D-alanyl-D-alanine carboxypeptidase [Clostridia bacterium]
MIKKATSAVLVALSWTAFTFWGNYFDHVSASSASLLAINAAASRDGIRCTGTDAALGLTSEEVSSYVKEQVEADSSESDAAVAPPKITAQAACLMEPATETVLFGKNIHQPLAPASITKVATAMVVLEKAKLDDVVTIPRQACGIEGSSMGLRPNQKYKVKDLLEAMLLISANDAAEALAIHVGGTREDFTAMVNRRLQDIGLLNTRFLNPHGISKPGHFSTAYDLALLGKWALGDDRFTRCVSSKTSTINELSEDRELHLANTNKLLWTYPGAEGIKTGTTQAAGNCLLAAAKRGEMRLIAVVLKSRDRWGDAARLLDWGFENFRLERPASAGQIWYTLRVTGGDQAFVDLACDSDLEAVVLANSQVALDMYVNEPVRAPVLCGEPLGVIRLRLGDKVLREGTLVAVTAVHRKTLIRTLLGAVSQIVVRLVPHL